MCLNGGTPLARQLVVPLGQICGPTRCPGKRQHALQETENVLGGALGVAHAPQMPVMVGGGQEGPEGTRQRGSIELSQMHDTGAEAYLLHS